MASKKGYFWNYTACLNMITKNRIKIFFGFCIVLIIIVSIWSQIEASNSQSFQSLKEELPEILVKENLFPGKKKNIKIFYLSGGVDQFNGAVYSVIVTDFDKYLPLVISIACKNQKKWKIYYIYKDEARGGLKQLYPPIDTTIAPYY